MGQWEEYCPLCGCSFTKPIYKEIIEQGEWDKPISSDLIKKLPPTDWFSDAIGINNDERVFLLGEYDLSGNFPIVNLKESEEGFAIKTFLTPITVYKA